MPSERYTPAPRLKIRERRILSSSLAGSSRSLDRSQRREGTCASRSELLEELASNVTEEEGKAEELFRAFDLGLDDSENAELETMLHDCNDEDANLSAQLSALFCETRLEAGAPSVSSPHVPHNLDPEAPLDKNTHFSTPMRMRHFPTLSPTILKMLLQSPSDYTPSPDTSSTGSILADSDYDDSFTDRDKDPTAQAGRQDDSWSFLGPAVSNSPSHPAPLVSIAASAMPLTPPPSARLPGSDVFPASSQETLFNGSSMLQRRSMDLQCIESTTLISPLSPSVSSPLSIFANKTAIAENKSQDIRDNARIFQYPLLSPSTIRNFLYVVEELRSLHEDPHENRGKLRDTLHAPVQSSAPPSIYLPPTPDIIDPHFQSAMSITPPFIESSPVIQKLELRRPKHRVGPPELRHESALQQEFAALLLTQAIDEEKQAAELRQIADRLEKVAWQRRRLASVTIAKGAGLAEWSKRECFVLV